jgi:fructokinase
VGEDELGEKAITALRHHGVNTRYVGRDQEHSTGTVRVELDEAGRPRFEITEGVAWDHILWTDDLEGLAQRADAVCFGTLAQRNETSRQPIQRFLGSTRPDCLRILDVNLRPPFDNRQAVLDSLLLANMLKLNDEELPTVASMCGLSGTGQDVLEELRDRPRRREPAQRSSEWKRVCGTSSGSPVWSRRTMRRSAPCVTR